MISDEILSSVKADLQGKVAIDVRIGLGYAAVMLDNGGLGMAYCFRNETEDCCEFVDDAGDLEGNAWELAMLLGNSDLILSSVGLATVNALLNQDVKGKEGDLTEFLDLEKGDKVGMVGYFEPTVKRLPDDVDLMIFDRSREGASILPERDMEHKLPEADVAIITGTSIINSTIDHLLELCRDARTVAILGPSTPITPIFREHGVDLLGGTVVEDAEMAMKIISQGGGSRSLGRACRKVTVDLK